MLAESNLAELAVGIPLFPLLAAAAIGLFGARWFRDGSHWAAIIGVAGALLYSVMLFSEVNRNYADYASDLGTEEAREALESLEQSYTLYEWFAVEDGVSFAVNFRLDTLTAVMMVMVCSVSLLVVIYSKEYMRHDGHPERGYERFFAFLCLFVFSMAMLVLGGNFLLLYLGWELVGLCSYLLIGFYYAKPEAAAAAKKAFLVNRIGDFGFALGILLLYLWLSPQAAPGESALDYEVAFRLVADGALAQWQCTVVALLLFCGAVGKSAQLPLYVWLPDAMEGPSPVSALIHAATMVTAGVYMVVRCGVIFAQSPTAMAVVATIGVVTALFAATMAIAQYDMKRILAYSTMSQLGYMFVGVGAYAADSAIFHLFTHAYFKALLFLGAGSVMHAMGGIIDVRRFGGLRRIMPYTFATFVIGSLALAGFPLLSGFFSKDEIIHYAFERSPLLGMLGLLTAVLTAIYTFRMVFLAFFGEERVPQGVHAHENGKWMTVPLMILAFGAVTAGYFGVHLGWGGFLGVLEPKGAIHSFLAPVTEPFAEAKAHLAAGGHEAGGHEKEGHGGHLLMYVSALLSIAGIGLAYVLFVISRSTAERIRQSAGGVFALLHHKYYVDEIYDAFVVTPLRALGRALYAIDRIVVDGLVTAVGLLPQSVGFVVRVFQNGAVQSYGVTMTAGMILIVLIVWLAT